jgi:uncharacterized protein
MLAKLANCLRRSLNLQHKQDIQTAAQALGLSWDANSIRLGDDCAAIPDGDGYLLLAAEGMQPEFVAAEPWFAGWSAVMVNVSDIYAMGGEPIAIVDTLWTDSKLDSKQLWAGMQAAAQAYEVPIVGGHTNCHSPYNALSVAILGRASQLITSFDARPDDEILMAADFRGMPYRDYPFWNAATTADPRRLRENLSILPRVARFCHGGKDISMGGLIGTLLMLLETSNCGAVLNIDRIPYPSALTLERWLTSFPSYGFLLSVPSQHVTEVQGYFQQQDLVCASIGEIQSHHRLILKSPTESVVFWDLSQEKLTGL